MAVRRQIWAPDTCGCEFEQTLTIDDTLLGDLAASAANGVLSITPRTPSGNLVASLSKFKKVCEAHEGAAGDLAALYATILVENEGKNAAYNAALAAVPTGYKIDVLDEFGQASGVKRFALPAPFRWNFDETRTLRWNIRTLTTGERPAVVAAVTAATTLAHNYDADNVFEAVDRFRTLVRLLWRRILESCPSITAPIIDASDGSQIGRRFLAGAKPTITVNVAQQRLSFDFSALGAGDRTAVLAALAPLFPGNTL